jgi:hypothetical protein
MFNYRLSCNRDAGKSPVGNVGCSAHVDQALAHQMTKPYGIPKLYTLDPKKGNHHCSKGCAQSTKGLEIFVFCVNSL